MSKRTIKNRILEPRQTSNIENRPAGRRAFTLIELMVIIIIIAVMSSVIVPAYNKLYQKTHFDKVTSAVLELFADAREQAIAQGITTYVSFDRQNQVFMLTQDQPPPPTDLPAVDASNPVMMTQSQPRVLQLGGDFAVPAFSATPVGGANGTPGSSGSSGQSSSPNRIAFQSDGTSDGADMTLLSSTGYMAHFVLMPATGKMINTDQ